MKTSSRLLRVPHQNATILEITVAIRRMGGYREDSTLLQENHKNMFCVCFAKLVDPEFNLSTHHECQCSFQCQPA